jgi:hypothetical protein
MAPRVTIADMQAQIDWLEKELEEARQETGRPPTYAALRQKVRFLTDANEHVREMAGDAEARAKSYWYKAERLKRELDEARSTGVTHTIYSDDAIAPDMLSRLIRLAHPDKHGNSPASNEVTSWLLAQRTGRIDS